MKSHHWNFMIAGLCLAIIALMYVAKFKQPYKPVFKQNRADFKNGEIILPDYAHDDTLVVVDSEGLNKGIEDCDGTDGDIDSVLHRFCTKY